MKKLLTDSKGQQVVAVSLTVEGKLMLLLGDEKGSSIVLDEDMAVALAEFIMSR